MGLPGLQEASQIIGSATGIAICNISPPNVTWETTDILQVARYVVERP